MKSSIPRLASITFKDGRKVAVLRNRQAEACEASFATSCGAVAHARKGSMIGYAIVAWGPDGSTTTALRIYDGRPVGTMMAPEFVRNALIDNIAATSVS